MTRWLATCHCCRGPGIIPSTHITGGEQPSLILISGDPKLSSETSLGTRHAYGAHTYKINQSKQE